MRTPERVRQQWCSDEGVAQPGGVFPVCIMEFKAMGDAQRIGKPFSSLLPYTRTPLLFLKTVLGKGGEEERGGYRWVKW